MSNFTKQLVAALSQDVARDADMAERVLSVVVAGIAGAPGGTISGYNGALQDLTVLAPKTGQLLQAAHQAAYNARRERRGPIPWDKTVLGADAALKARAWQDVLLPLALELPPVIRDAGAHEDTRSHCERCPQCTTMGQYGRYALVELAAGMNGSLSRGMAGYTHARLAWEILTGDVCMSQLELLQAQHKKGTAPRVYKGYRAPGDTR